MTTVWQEIQVGANVWTAPTLYLDFVNGVYKIFEYDSTIWTLVPSDSNIWV